MKKTLLLVALMSFGYSQQVVAENPIVSAKDALGAALLTMATTGLLAASDDTTTAFDYCMINGSVFAALAGMTTALGLIDGAKNFDGPKALSCMAAATWAVAFMCANQGKGWCERKMETEIAASGLAVSVPLAVALSAL